MNFREIFCYILVLIIAVFLAQHINVVASGSMEPVLCKGDVIIVNDYNNDIQVGDIIVYNGTCFNPPIKIVHRVIEKKQTDDGFVYITKGDHNLHPDINLVQQNQIISKVISINDKPLKIPKIGYIYLQNMQT